MPYLLGIDIGTSSVKTLILQAETGLTLTGVTQEYPVLQPQPGYAEQNPSDWWRATVGTIRSALDESGIAPDGIVGIGLSGQMHGVVCIDAQHEVVRTAIIWADTRSKPQVDTLLANMPAQVMSQHAPGQPAAGFMGPTLMWLQAHEPETLQRTKAVLLPKDYIQLRLTGEITTDASDGAATWLMDVKSGAWSDTLIASCGIDSRYLPPVKPSDSVVGQVTPGAAEQLGIPAGIPVIAGCADQCAQALGYGLFDPGTALVTIGTGGQVFMPLAEPRIDPQLRYYVFNHAVARRWYAAAAILCAGLALRWLRDTLGFKDRSDAYAHLSHLAADVPPGADGLIFLPYLTGERTPHMDPLASGLFLGLRIHHTPGHLARAVMEGVTFALRECLDLVTIQEAMPPRIIISGGATASPVWRQIQADVYNQTVWLAEGENHACVGAALLAGVGCGVYPDFATAATMLPQPEIAIEPHQQTANFYAAYRQRYAGLYAKLKEDMHWLSAQ